MTTITDKTKTVESLTTTAQNSLSFFHAEISKLRIIESVFGAIEQNQLEIVPRTYAGVAALIKQITEIESMPSDSIERSNAANNIRREIENWKANLIKRDEDFSAFDLRSYCENLSVPLDTVFFVTLAGFYRNLPQTRANLGKFDYSVTQIFSQRTEKNRRALRMEAEKIVIELRRLNNEWGSNPHVPASNAELRESIKALAVLSAQAKKIKTLRRWLESEFFQHTRATKQNLIKTFFTPEVTAAIVVCNLVIGNHFAALCEADNEKLAAAADSFAADENNRKVIIGQLKNSIQLLSFPALEDDLAESIACQRLNNLVGLTEEPKTENIKEPTQNAEAETTAEIIETTTAAEAENSLEKSELTNSAQQNESAAEQNAEPSVKKHPSTEAEAVIAELSRSKPNVAVIFRYLEKSDTREIKQLRLNPFLLPETDPSAKNLRRALRLILQSEDAVRFVNAGEGNLTAEFQEKIHLLHEEIHLINNRLRRLIQESAAAVDKVREDNDDYDDDEIAKHEKFEDLLYVANVLVEAQLSLNSAVVRRRAREEERRAALESASTVPEIKKILLENAHQQSEIETNHKPWQINKSLFIAATALVLIVGGWQAIGFFNDEKPLPVFTNNVKSLDPKSLKGGTELLAAKINKNTLFASVGKEWNSLPLEKKKENILLLLAEGERNGYKKVLLFNEKGDNLGYATAEEYKVL
jgi:hypothetical protein